VFPAEDVFAAEHVFPADDWPLHLTLVPPFDIDLAPDAVAARFPKPAPITVTAGGEALFGARRSVPVTLIQPSNELTELHAALVDALEAAGARIRDQKHIREGYRPHATSQRSARLRAGDSVAVDSLALVDRAPAGLPGSRRVAALVPLR
jgi:2'-5' RNA ligase